MSFNRRIDEELKQAEADLKELALHVSPRLLLTIESLVRVCHLQLKELRRINAILPQDDGR